MRPSLTCSIRYSAGSLFAEGIVADPFTLIPAVMGASITATTPFHSPFLTAVKVRKAAAVFFVKDVDTQTIHKHRVNES